MYHFDLLSSVSHIGNEQRTESASLTLDADAPSPEGALFFPVPGLSFPRRRESSPDRKHVPPGI